jgi:hypothetical protein
VETGSETRSNPVVELVSTVKRRQSGRSTARRLLIVGEFLVVLLGAPDPEQTLRERRVSMSKSASADEAKAVRNSTTPPARDPRMAVEEEYQLARRQGTTQALELFIARHPDDPLTVKARADLRLLSR